MTDLPQPNPAVKAAQARISALCAQIFQTALALERDYGIEYGKVAGGSIRDLSLVLPSERSPFCVISIITAPMNRADLDFLQAQHHGTVHDLTTSRGQGPVRPLANNTELTPFAVPEKLRAGVARLKQLATTRIPDYELPADSFLEAAVFDILTLNEPAVTKLEVYTIARKVHQVYGHGDSGYEWMICPKDSYGMGDYPPAFKTRAAAEAHLATIPFNSELAVVSLKLTP